MILVEEVRNKSKKLEYWLSQTRRKLHMMPEVALEEFETSSYIVDELKKMGISEIEIVADTGVIAIIRGDKEGKTIAIRADIDALPIQENNIIEYKSINDGIMHACGHDGHITMALGAAKILHDLKIGMNGNVKFIFQPAEEQFGGAQRIINAGALKNPDVDAIMALHLWPEFRKGTICINDGCIMASNDKFEIKIKGSGGHGAMPDLCIDALLIACQVVNAIQIFVSREVNPSDSVVITVGTFHSGTSYNIIADEAVITGTTRSTNEKIRGKIKSRLQEITQGICNSFNAKYEFNYIRQYPPTINDKIFSAFLNKVAVDVNGYDNVIKFDKTFMTGEDFAYYLQNVQGSMCFIGTRDEEFNYPLHNQKFNFNEDVLCTGTAFLVATTINYLMAN